VKFIITTNLRNLSDMDHAIYRPGRCFDHIIFDKLTAPQQGNLLSAMGYPDDVVPNAPGRWQKPWPAGK
jgi:hypothetical protein